MIRVKRRRIVRDDLDCRKWNLGVCFIVKNLQKMILYKRLRRFFKIKRKIDFLYKLLILLLGVFKK